MNFLVPLQDYYRMIALNWLTFMGVTTGLLYLVPEQFLSQLVSFSTCAAVTLIPPGVFIAISYITFKTSRRILWMSLLTGIGFLPQVALLVSLDFLYLFSMPTGSRLPLVATTVISVFLWCCWRVIRFRQLVVERDFIEREFAIENSCIVVSHPQTTSLELKKKTTTSALTKLLDKAVPYVAVICPSAFLLQRWIINGSGYGAIFMLLATLAYPLTLYLLGRMACGGYLWVYWPLKLSLRHRKAVIVQSA